VSILYLVGGFNPSEKYYPLLTFIAEPVGSTATPWPHLKNISQLGLFFPIYGKIKTVPNTN
jgi:hypothetical protein